LKNPAEMNHFIPNLIHLGLDNLKHDPNYVQDGDEEDEMPDSQSDVEEDDEFEEEEYSDDDDVSWKVRRAAAKLLWAVIVSYPSVLPDIYRDVAPVLIFRFNEREESVRVEILSTFRELVHVTGQQGDEIMLSRDVPVGAGKRRRESSQSGERPIVPKALGSQLSNLVPIMSKALTRQLAGHSVPTKLAGITLAREVVEVLNGGLGDVLPSFIRPVESAMEIHGVSKSSVGPSGAANESNLKIETLKFIKAVFVTHVPTSIGTDSAVHLAKVVNNAIANERFYKVVAEALDAIVPVIACLSALKDENSLNAIAESIRGKVVAADLDQEVREKSILALGAVLKTLGPAAGFPLLFERLRLESVRLVTVKVIADVIEYSSISDAHWVDGLTAELSTYLRRNNRDVKVASLKALQALLSKYPGAFSQDRIDDVVDNLCSVLASDDIQLYPSTLETFTLALQHHSPSWMHNWPRHSNLNILGTLFYKQVPTQGAGWIPYGNFLTAASKSPFGARIWFTIKNHKSLDSCDANELSVIAKVMAIVVGGAGPDNLLLGGEFKEVFEINEPVEGVHLQILKLMTVGECGRLMFGLFIAG
jgi:hypothetical protein